MNEGVCTRACSIAHATRCCAEYVHNPTCGSDDPNLRKFVHRELQQEKVQFPRQSSYSDFSFTADFKKSTHALLLIKVGP